MMAAMFGKWKWEDRPHYFDSKESKGVISTSCYFESEMSSM